VVEAILFLARTGCQWRYLPERYPPWEAVWQQWRRWRKSGVWAKAMLRIAKLIRTRKGRTATPSMVMIDGQTVRGGRAGPTFHEKGGRGGRTNGAKRSIAIEILGLPLAVSVESARPHDVSAGRRLLATALPKLGTVQDVIADRGYRGMGKMAANNGLNLRIKAPPKGTSGFTPIAPLYKVEHRLRAPRPLAAAVALLRGLRRERPRLARGGLARLPVRSPAGRACLTSLLRRRALHPGAGHHGVMREPPPYFVRRLPATEARPGARFEVQVLYKSGRSRAEARFDEESIVEVEGVAIPEAVLEAARRQPPGQGDYVGRDGTSLPPF
jgi:transposase